MQTLEQIKFDLKNFWLGFNLLNENYKLELLKEYSEKKYVFKTRQPLAQRRLRFNAAKRFKKLFLQRCRICRFTPVIRHHIISLKNGGDNRRKNIVTLCRECHAKIHPWLKI